MAKWERIHFLLSTASEEMKQRHAGQAMRPGANGAMVGKHNAGGCTIAKRMKATSGWNRRGDGGHMRQVGQNKWRLIVWNGGMEGQRLWSRAV